jgi:release factor glutamine methyltransferase
LPDGIALVAGGATVRDAIRGAAATLARAGCERSRLDAELLLASVLGVDRARLVTDSRAEVHSAELRRFDRLVRRREEREPVAYILGLKEFRHVTLAVDRRVLIPRPETELLVEAGLSVPAGASVVDVGTGSGAVALALKHERPDLAISATDVDPDAVALAAANASRLGLEVSFVVGDLVAGLACDAVLANLPYVADGATLAPEIRDWEPASALFAGADGLDAIRRLVASLDAVPFVALEIGYDQADSVASLLAGAGYRSVERRRDLAGHARVLVARR